jgi:hypothetical protein
MPRYEQRDVSFDVPRHWEDKTLVAFAEPPTSGRSATPSLVMTRDGLDGAASLSDYADQQIAELAQRLDAFELVGRDDCTIGGMAAVSVRFRSKAAGGPLEQRLVMTLAHRRQVYCFTATAPKVDAAQADPLFDRMLASVRFTSPGEDA